MTKVKVDSNVATFNYHGSEITVRALRVRDVLASEAVMGTLSRLRPNDLAWGVNQFARFWVSVDAPEGVLPVPPLDLSGGSDVIDERITTAYEAFMDADSALLDGWATAYDAANSGKAATATDAA